MEIWEPKPPGTLWATPGRLLFTMETYWGVETQLYVTTSVLDRQERSFSPPIRFILAGEDAGWAPGL